LCGDGKREQGVARVTLMLTQVEIQWNDRSIAPSIITA